MLERIDLCASKGRIKIRMQVELIGAGLLVKLTGGSRHVGAIALASPGQGPHAISAPGHRENELACKVAGALRDRLAGSVAVVAGIHYDCITKAEIGIVYNLAQALVERFIRIREGCANADNEGSGGI